MTIQNYLMINDEGVIENTIVWDGNIETWQPPSGYRMQVQTVEQIGGRFIDGKYVAVSPYQSWVLNADFEWEAPVPMPVEDGISYYWDEGLVQWIRVEPVQVPKQELPPAQ